MTNTRYLIARIAKAFGYVRRNHRMSEAATEVHLLREAETYLGMKAWENVEPIDALSAEYWNLRKLVKQSNQVQSRLSAFREQLEAAHEQRARLVNDPAVGNDPLASEQAAHQQAMTQLLATRDELVREARQLHRQYNALKTKREVLIGESRHSRTTPQNDPKIRSLDEEAQRIRQRFEELKSKREEVGQLLADGQRREQDLAARLHEARSERVDLATEEFQRISEINKELSRLRAELGLLEVRIRQLYSEIGRHLSLNSTTDPACRAAVRKHQGLVDVMKALRHSVLLNQRLLDRD